MIPEFKEGMRVNTKLGPGRIVEFRGYQNIIVAVDRLNGLKIRQAYNDLTLIEISPRVEPPVELVPPIELVRQRTRTIPDEAFLKLRAIEALRFGLVPETRLPDLTVQYEELKRWVLKSLPHSANGRSRVAEACGAYGTGKSHTMAVVRHIAEMEGYVTAHVALDGIGVTLADPERFLGSLWSGLRAEGFQSATPLLDLYRKAIDARHPAPNITPRNPDRIANNYLIIQKLKGKGRLENYEYLLDSIISSSGEYTATDANREIGSDLEGCFLKRMIGTKVVDRSNDFVESLFGHAIISRMAGYRGLVVTIDEFEVQHNGLHWDRVSTLIDTIVAYIKGDTAHTPAPITLFFATLGEEGHEGDAIIDFMIDECDGNYLQMRELEKKDLFEISKRIFFLYQTTYNIENNYDPQLAASAYEWVGHASGRVRAFIKQYVSLLDETFRPPRI